MAKKETKPKPKETSEEYLMSQINSINDDIKKLTDDVAKINENLNITANNVNGLWDKFEAIEPTIKLAAGRLGLQ